MLHVMYYSLQLKEVKKVCRSLQLSDKGMKIETNYITASNDLIKLMHVKGLRLRWS